MRKPEVYIVSAARTPVGNFCGSLSSLKAHQLGSIAIKAALERAKLNQNEVCEVVMGQALLAGQGQNPARQAATEAGIPFTTTAYNVSMLCGSGMKSINLGYQTICSDDAEIVVAGGQESMSQAPHVIPMRNGVKMGKAELVDSMLEDGLVCAFCNIHMGETAENIARQYGISREEQDQFAVESQKKTEEAQNRNLFDKEIVPVNLKIGKEMKTISKDEFPRAGVTAESLARLRPVFVKAARRAAENLGLVQLSPDRARMGQPLEDVEKARQARLVREAEVAKLLEEHMEKNLHSVFFRHMGDENLSPELTFAFLRSAGLRSETEGFLMAVQDGVWNTLVYRRAILKQEIASADCRACRSRPETEGGTVTAGNASGINDGAAVVVLMSEQKVKEKNLKPLARIVGFAQAGVEPNVMGLGPVPAIKKLLEKISWKIEEVDLFELNEAFAAQAIAVVRDLGVDKSKVNINGGAIAIGHPIGASGCRIVVTLIHALQQTGKKKGIAALCIGGGMGIAMALERIE